MKRLIFTLLTSLLVLGSLSAETRRYETFVGDFSKLKVLDNANVLYRCVPDSTGLAVFEGAEEFADAYILTLAGETLKVQVNLEDVDKPDLPVLHVYSSSLTEASNEADSRLTVVNPKPCDEFKARQINNGELHIHGLNARHVKAQLLTGKGLVQIDGKARSVQYKLTGTGIIKAPELVAEDASCTIFGTGAIYLTALESLKVKGLGSTKIYYLGNPKEVKKSGGAKLVNMEGNQ